MRERRLYEEQCRTPGISSIKYHEPLNRVIVTSESQDTSCSIYLFNPVQNPPDEAGPSWLLGQSKYMPCLLIHLVLRILVF